MGRYPHRCIIRDQLQVKGLSKSFKEWSLTVRRYKREAYRGSEFAARVLADEGVPVVLKVEMSYGLTLSCPNRILSLITQSQIRDTSFTKLNKRTISVSNLT